MRRLINTLLAVAGATLLLVVCLQSNHAAENAGAGGGEGAPHVTTFSIKELMDAIVDPSADGIWGAVAVISDEKGTQKREPRTPAEWHAVRQDVIKLIESMNLVMTPGRHAAPAGTERVPGELSSKEIDALLVTEREVLIAYAKQLQETTGMALDAVEKRDPAALFKAGSEIDEACESCHQTFWYPNQK